VQRSLIAVGDINLMNVVDPSVPFRRIAAQMAAADVRVGNLECCLYDTPADHSLSREGFYAPKSAGPALASAGFDLLGLANNVNYGAEAILSSCAELDRLGIAHAGAGADLVAAEAPVVIERDGVRYGFTQRTSVYWPIGHAATERSPGVAVLQGNTAYQPLLHRTQPHIPPMNRPGLPPRIITWTEPAALARYRTELRELRSRCDIMVVAHHWGLAEDVLEYQSEIAHAAVDEGADLVIGHGPHYSLAIELYRGKPVFYGLGSFAFHTGHGGRKHPDWRGEMAQVTFDGHHVARVAFWVVRHNEANETECCPLDGEAATIERLQHLCDRFGTKLQRDGEQLVVEEARS